MTDDVTLKSCINDALSTLKDHLDREDDPWEGDQNDMIHELADSNVPGYSATILRIAAEEPEIGSVAPENGPAFDGTNTPVNVAAANIYEAIEAALWEYLNERETA